MATSQPTHPASDTPRAQKRARVESHEGRTVFLARHAERLDRAWERSGKQWLSVTARPQDPPISPAGREQAQKLGQRFKGGLFGVVPTRIISSPLIRCVQTSEIVARTLGLGADSIFIEEGLCEEAKSMRDPKPPYLLRAADLCAHSDRICVAYEPKRPVKHRFDADATVRDLQRQPEKLEKSGGSRELHCVRELHDSIPDVDTTGECSTVVKELIALTQARCSEMIEAVLADETHNGHTLLLVGHGASVQYTINHLAKTKVRGEVSGYAVLRQPAKDAEWLALTGSEALCRDHLDGAAAGAEDITDRG